MAEEETINQVVYGPNIEMINFSAHRWIFKIPEGKTINDLTTKELMDIGYFDE